MFELIARIQRRTLSSCIAKIIAVTTLLYSCATVLPPTGGLPDKDPPYVIAALPAPRAIQTPTKIDVRIQFNEWIMNPVPRSAVRISPPLEKPLTPEVDEDVLGLSSKSSLDSLTTYTVTVGSALQDLHGNGLSRPFQLVFSTGPQVDTLQVRGVVQVPDSLLRKKSFPTIGLYPIGEAARAQRNYLKKLRDSTFTGSDTAPRLFKEPVLYLSQTDSLGRFRIDGIGPGRYRVAAFYDVNNNNRIDITNEIAGLAQYDIVVDTTFHDTLYMTMANQDTSSPRQVSSTVEAPHFASVEFSRDYKVDSTNNKACGLWKMDSTLYRSSDLAWIAADTKKLMLYFDSVSADSNFLLGCSTQGRMKIRWVPAKDSLSQRLISFRVFGMSPVTDSLPQMELAYNLPLRADTLGKALRLIANKDTLAVVASQIDPVRIRLQPAKPVSMGVSYRLIKLNPDTTTKATLQDTTKVAALQKSTTPDTTAKSKPATLATSKQDTAVVKAKPAPPAIPSVQLGSFETANPLKLGKLAGKIRGANTKTRVRLRSVPAAIPISTLCDLAGAFHFDKMPEGPYMMDVYEDLGKDSLPFAGKIIPYQASGFWRSVRDTVHVGSDITQGHIDSLLAHIQFPQRSP